MDRPLLNDADQFPDDEVLAAHLGKAKPAWDAFAVEVEALLGRGAIEWRFYKDGGAWLCKVVHKKKTVCWASVWDRFFKVVFYFTAKNDADIAAMAIPDEIKQAYQDHAPIGKLKPLIVIVKTKKALDPIPLLVRYKAGLK
jgi:hypothetical protein